MFRVNNESRKIEMNEGDFGLILTFNFDEIQEGSNFKFKIYKSDEVILEKDITNIEGNEVNLSLTEEESEEIKEGTYRWSFLQYIDEALKNTLVVDSLFEVKAGA